MVLYCSIVSLCTAQYYHITDVNLNATFIKAYMFTTPGDTQNIFQI